MSDSGTGTLDSVRDLRNGDRGLAAVVGGLSHLGFLDDPGLEHQVGGDVAESLHRRHLDLHVVVLPGELHQFGDLGLDTPTRQFVGEGVLLHVDEGQ